MPQRSEMIRYEDCFDELYVVSDLHWGGMPGRRIFRSAVQFKTFVEGLSGADGKRVGLVLNGDIVDFLADERESCFEPARALQKLEEWLGDGEEELNLVFEALRKLTSTPGRTLALVLGNHDVELAMPDVSERFLRAICENDAARGRVRLALDGTGYSCTVGGRRVFCTHGNDVDAFNYVDPSDVRRHAVARKSGAEMGPWTPNAGSLLVVEIMNAFKERWPFVDLLKPEVESVVPILLSLDPKGVGDRLDRVAPLLRNLVKGYFKVEAHKMGLLGGEAEAEEGPRRAPAVTSADDVDTLLRRAELAFEEDRTPVDLLTEEGTLGPFAVVWDWIRGRKPRESLRTTFLEWEEKRGSMEIGHEDDQFKALDAAVGENVHFLIAGHTHLRRFNKRRKSGYYFNSGSWIRLIKLERTFLEDERKFRGLLDAIESGDDEALDEYVANERTVVKLSIEGREVHGQLLDVKDDGSCSAVENTLVRMDDVAAQGGKQ